MKFSQIKRGEVINLDGVLWVVQDYDHVKPGKGTAYYQVRIKNVDRGNVLVKRMNPTDDVEVAYIESARLEYLYSDATGHIFMDQKTFEQTIIQDDVIGERMKYIRPNQPISVRSYQGKPVEIELPPTVVLKVEETEPSAKGDTVKKVTKPARVETNAEFRVPAFITAGDWIRIDTRTGECTGRASESERPE